jgi:hypothetical protein
MLLLAGHVFDLGGHPKYGTVLGQSLVLVAHLALVFALIGLYAAQAPRSGLLGTLGMVLSVLSTALVSGVVLVEIAGAAGVEVDMVLAGGVAGMLTTFAGLGFFVGLILFCITTFRTGIFPRLASVVLLAGDLVFAASTGAGPSAQVVTIAGAALTCAGFVWLGLALIAQTRNNTLGV